MINRNIRRIIIDKVALMYHQSKIKVINQEYQKKYYWNDGHQFVSSHTQLHSCNYRNVSKCVYTKIYGLLLGDREITFLPKTYHYSSGCNYYYGYKKN